MDLIFLEGNWSSKYTHLRSWGASKNDRGWKFNFLRGGRGFFGAGGHSMVGFRRLPAAVGVWHSSGCCSWKSLLSMGIWRDGVNLKGVSGRNSSITSIPILQKLKLWGSSPSPVIQVLMAEGERKNERENGVLKAIEMVMMRGAERETDMWERRGWGRCNSVG